MKRFLVALALVGAMPALAFADDAATLFSKLDLPSVKTKRWVRFNTGQHWTDQEEHLQFVCVTGWLLDERPNEVELLTRGLVRRTFPRKRDLPEGWDPKSAPAGLPPPAETCDLDFDELCTKFLEGGVQRYFGFDAMEHAREGGLDHPTEAALFAHWQRERGNEEIAQRLLRLGEQSFEKAKSNHGRGETPADYATAVASSLATNLRWKAITGANEDHLTRRELVATWKTIAALAKGEQADEAKRMIADYESLLAEDETFTELGPEDLLKKSPGERAVYWRHLLRDHAARQMMQPGGVMVLGPFSGLDEHTTNAADELVKLGWDAIPALIEGLADARPTRCMGYWRDFAPGSYYLLTIGDCCQQIFEEISGERVYERASTSGAMTKDGRAAAAQKAAREWWDKVKEKGERAFLLEVVAKGDAEGCARAERLVTRFPDDAIATLQKGITNATEERARAYLVSLVAGLDRVGALEILEAEARDDRALPVRIAATRGLLRKGQKSAARALIPEWENRATDEHVESLVGILAAAGDPECVRALGKDLAKRPPRVRQTVVTSLGEGGSYSVMFMGEGPGLADGHATEPASKARRAEWETALEDVLASELEDEFEITGMSGQWNGKSFSDPRLCDIAAHTLWSRWPDRYAFDLSASLGARDRARARCSNTWRSARGLPAIAVPEPRPVLAELAAIESRLAAEPELAAVASRIACTVVDAVIAKDSVAPDEPWRTKLDALRGKPLEREALIAMLVDAAKALPEDARGFRVAATRESDGTGVVVTVEFLRAIAPPSGGMFGAGGKRLASVDTSESVTLGRRGLHGSSGSGALDYHQSAKAYDRLAESIDECLRSPRRTPFAIKVTLAFHPADR